MPGTRSQLGLGERRAKAFAVLRTKQCTRCGESKPLDEFPVRGDGYRMPKCSPCMELIRVEAADRLRLKRFGITPEQYAEMIATYKNLCAVCHAPPGMRALDIDHNHETGQIRGLLCSGCNRALGLLSEDPDRLRRLADYIEEWNRARN